jgi:hypothetical protein
MATKHCKITLAVRLETFFYGISWLLRVALAAFDAKVDVRNGLRLPSASPPFDLSGRSRVSQGLPDRLHLKALTTSHA